MISASTSVQWGDRNYACGAQTLCVFPETNGFSLELLSTKEKNVHNMFGGLSSVTRTLFPEKDVAVEYFIIQ